jgi:O-antigen/teichoic acid export membrane protein
VTEPAERRRLRAGRGAVAAIASRVGARMLGLGFIVVLAREGSTTEFAAYSYLLAIAATASLLADLGVALIAGREVARGHVEVATAYRAGAFAVTATSLFAAVGSGLFGLVDNGPGTAGWPLFWLTLFLLTNGLFNFQTELLRASGRPWVEAGLQTVLSALWLASGTTIVALGLSFSTLMAAFALKQIVVMAAAQRWLPLPWHGAPSPDLWKLFIRRGLWLSAATTFLAIVLRIAPVILGNVGTTEELAVYSVATRFLEISVMVCQTAGFGLLPSMSQRSAEDPAAAREFMRRVQLFGVGAALIVTPLVVLVLPPVVTLIFGHRYEAAGGVAQVLVGLQPLLIALYLAWYALVAQRRERGITFAAGVGAAAALAGAAWVVYRKDAYSAAEATGLGVAVSAAAATGLLLFGRAAPLPRPLLADDGAGAG